MVFYFKLIIFVSLSFESILLSDGETGCRVKGNCGDCIQSQRCSWCSRVKGMESPKSGCYDSNSIPEVCEEDFIENPKSVLVLTVDKPINDGQGDETVQLRPQEAELKIRPGDQITIDLEFKKLESYPIDLYYLMDFSHSMSKYKNKLSQLGSKLAQTMKNITTNFQIGFGSFVDKVTLPYTSTVPSDLEKPCSNDCRSPYSFKNHLSLNKNTEKFSIEVKKAKMSGNLDTPEGVLDALMQAIVCQKEIHWREKARHVLVLSTDAEFHLAGDGKLGGIFEPNDGNCHLNGEGYYTHGLIFDYPSVSHINRKAVDNNMNIIFAVTKKVKETYLSLSNEIHGATLGLLDRGEDIADLVRAQYEKISTTIQLTDNARSPIFITYSTLCPGDKEYRSNTAECSGIKGGSTVRFKAHITVTDCSENELTEQEIKIKPLGINETFTVYLQTICNCDCSESGYPGTEKNSSLCSGSGDLICGRCICQNGKIGEKCECDDRGSFTHDDSLCVAPNSTNSICSGLGECKCGVCRCRKLKNPNEEISGRYCECDNFSCEKQNGLLCSGNGKCNCKKCTCNPGWTGESCDCSLDDHQCRVEPNGEVCSGKGNCICGVCHCNNQTDEHHYSGKYCQICMTCTAQCDLYNDCVESLMDDRKSYDSSNCTEKFLHEFVEDTKEAHENTAMSSLCVIADNSGCTIKYVYYFNESDQLVILVEKEKHCPEEINLVAVIAGTTGSTVLLGILIILIWKIVTTYYDKREFEKFEKERKLAKWGKGENPLFKTAVTTYKNVAYKKEG